MVERQYSTNCKITPWLTSALPRSGAHITFYIPAMRPIIGPRFFVQSLAKLPPKPCLVKPAGREERVCDTGTVECTLCVMAQVVSDGPMVDPLRYHPRG